jgi:hypothetical protein
LHVEGPPSAVEDRVQRGGVVEVGTGQCGERLGLLGGELGRARPARRELHRPADDRRHEDEDGQREGLLALGDVEGMRRLDEEEVDEQCGHDRARQRDEQPADERHADDRQQIEQDLAFEREPVADRVERERQQW